MKRTRKHLTAQEKMSLLRRHVVDKVPVSAICEEAKLQPTVFYRWLRQLLENGAAALERANLERANLERANGAPPQPDLAAKRRIAHLEERLRTKDPVLAGLMEEHVALKQSLGEG